MANVKVCDICDKRDYQIETFSLFTGNREFNGVETENEYNSYDLCVSCMSQFLFYLNDKKIIPEILLNNNLQTYIKMRKTNVKL
jgi:hypothetical protein